MIVAAPSDFGALGDSRTAPLRQRPSRPLVLHVSRAARARPVRERRVLGSSRPTAPCLNMPRACAPAAPRESSHPRRPRRSSISAPNHGAAAAPESAASVPLRAARQSQGVAERPQLRVVRVRHAADEVCQVQFSQDSASKTSSSESHVHASSRRQPEPPIYGTAAGA